MEQLTLLFEQHGYFFLFGLGFLEFIGAPIAGVPMLIAAGGLAAAGGISIYGTIVAAAAGGFFADIIWYSTARWRGRGLVDSVCGLSSNPKACVLGVEKKLASLGPGYLLPAKFIPGVGNLVAAASGFAPVSFGAFLLLDGLGVLAWASVFSGLGWVFSAQVELAVSWAGQFVLWLVAGGGALMGAAGAWRVMKVRMHRAGHQTMLESSSTNA
jgi:membrane protein DedA with SNARE-associated domain